MRHPGHQLGVLYYAFPVALADITADTGWSATAATAAFSAGLIVSGARRHPDRSVAGPLPARRVMTGGSLLAVPATVAIAVAPSYGWFLAAWLVARVAMAAVFYQATFAALTRWYGERRAQAITAVTLVAGLSSTIVAPLTQALLDHLDWRTTYLVLAAALAMITVPLHALALTPPVDIAPGPRCPGSRRRLPVEARTPSFVLLSAALTLTAFGLYAASLHADPATHRARPVRRAGGDHAGLLGAGQLLGRVGYPPLTARTSPAADGGHRRDLAGTIALLAALPGPPALLVASAIAAGAARGAGTLLQATVVADRWGATRFGTLSGLFSAPITAASALAPWGGTALAELVGSYPAMFWALTGLVVLAAVLAAIGSRAR